MADDARLAGGARRRLPLALALAAALLSLGAGPTGGVTELRPAGLMHENLAAVNQIVEAVARHRGIHHLHEHPHDLTTAGILVRKLLAQLVEVDPEQPGQKLDEGDHGHDAEGIGQAVADGEL